jgi:cation diffusion facilitator family transporter
VVEPVAEAAQTRRDQRLLLVSVAVSAAFAVISSVWGLLSGSSMIVFDGLYSFASVGLSMLAVFGLRFARRGPDERFPWGREAVEPLVVVVKAATLGALCLYAAVGGIGDLLSGGRDVELGSAVGYGVFATVAGLVTAIWLRVAARRRDTSDLVCAEAAEWVGDSLLSVGVLVGFCIALGLAASGRDDLARYIDPAMVVLVSAAFLWVPVKLIIGAVREIIGMAPQEEVLDVLQQSVREVGREFGLPEPSLRAAKVGGRMDIEIDYVVGEDSAVRTIADCDAVREQLYARLAALGLERSLLVSFTTDPRWT